MNHANVQTLIRWRHEATMLGPKTHCSHEHGGRIKKRFATMEEAIARLDAMHRRFHIRGSVYRCQDCGGYHITRQRPKRGVNGKGGMFFRSPVKT